MSAERVLHPIDERCIKDAARYPRIDVERLDAIFVEWNDAKRSLYELAVKQAEAECGVTYFEIDAMYENARSPVDKFLSNESIPGFVYAFIAFSLIWLIPLLIYALYERVFPRPPHENVNINRIHRKLESARFTNCDRLIGKYFADRCVAFYIGGIFGNPSQQTSGPRGGYVQNGVIVTTCPKSPRCVSSSAVKKSFICQIAKDPNGVACATYWGRVKDGPMAYSRYVSW